MSPRNTGILLLLAVAVGAFVYFYEFLGEESRTQAEAEAKRLFPGHDAEAIDSIELTTSDGVEARIERRRGDGGDAGWELVTPLVFPADTFNADSLASSLSGLASERKLEDPQPPEVYGLDSASTQVTFHASGEERALRIGKHSPVGGNSYVSIVGSDDVHIVKSFTVSAFDKPFDDLRRKRIASFDRDSIEKIEVRWPDGRAALERTADGWTLIEPLHGPADSESVDKMLSDLSFLRAEGFVDDPIGDEEAGLARPDFQVHLSGSAPGDGDDPVEVDLAIGQRYQGDFRLVRADLPSLFRIPATGLNQLPASLIQLRFRTLSDYDDWDAKRLEIVFQDQETVLITAERGEEGWSSEPERVDSEKLRTLVQKLSKLRATDILAESMGEKELRALDLDPPKVVYKVYGSAPDDEAEGEASSLFAEIHIGTFRGEGDGIVARTAGNPMVFELDGALAKDVPVSLEAFRNRYVGEEVPAMDPALDPGDAPE